MTNQHKAILILGILLTASLAGNIYFWSTTKEDSNDDLIRSQQKEEMLREQLSMQESKNDSIQLLYDTKKNEIDTFKIYIEAKNQDYENKKSHIFTISADSSYSFFTDRLSKADTL